MIRRAVNQRRIFWLLGFCILGQCLPRGLAAPAHGDAPATATVATGSAEVRFGLKFALEEFTPPAVSHATLDNGMTLDYYAERDIPLVTVLVRVGAGSVDDPPGKVGAAAMTADVWRNGGSASLSGDELDRQLEDRGALLTTGIMTPGT
ncbi:MAG: hypothetical protein M1457_04370, partial [bacterium]|nr:hypothetical protein [bacterium]